GEAGVGLGDVDRGSELLGFLRLDGAFDHRQRLAGTDPLAGLDQNARDHPALACDSDRHVPPGGERAGGGEVAGDFLTAGDDHRDGRGDVAAGLLGRGCLLAAAHHEVGGDREQKQSGDHYDDDPAPPAGDRRAFVVYDYRAVERSAAPPGRFDIHRFHIPHTGKGGTRTASATVLAEYITWLKPLSRPSSPGRQRNRSVQALFRLYHG